MTLSIVIVSFNTRDITWTCLEKIFRHPPAASFEVMVVDNASEDGTIEMVAAQFPQVRIIALRENKGFAGGNNEGIRCASGRYFLLLNSDAFIGPGVLDATLAFMEENPEAGILGCRLVGHDGALQPCARMFPGHVNKILTITGLAARFPNSRFFGRANLSWWDHGEVRKVDWVVGAYFLVRREVFDTAGLLDERYFLYHEEVDFCRSAQARGWDVVFFPHAQVVHLGGSSIKQGAGPVSPKGRQLTKQRIRSELRYYRKWRGPLHAALSALIELSWLGLAYVKNLPFRSAKAMGRKKECREIMGLIVSLLIEDRLGKG